MKELYTPPKGNDRLRAMDRVVREVLWQYPNVPRPIHDPLYPARNRQFIVKALFCTTFIVLFIYVLPVLLTGVQTGSIWRSQYVIALFVPLLIIYFLYLTIHPFYDWSVGIRYGRRTTAIIQEIIDRPSATGVRGTWEINIDGKWISQKFTQSTFEQQTWIEDLRVGDRINVLVHPSKSIVLIAYGP